ncbi:MAG: hypothetical protein GYB53_25010 [Rhodobacteraceae bacterium]|nr:hypothetical protein [Paracoccaceae bacterium]MBR9823983.1 hypothetical protein [Paracoccaceae bacterium]
MSFMSQSSAPDGADAQPTLLDIVMQALEVTGRIPAKQPRTDFPRWFTTDRIEDFYIEPRNGGWVSTITFRDMPPGMPNCLGSPDEMPYRDRRDAFLHGAGILCEIVTGSRDLPFTVVGDQLVVVARRA